MKKIFCTLVLFNFLSPLYGAEFLTIDIPSVSENSAACPYPSTGEAESSPSGSGICKAVQQACQCACLNISELKSLCFSREFVLRQLRENRALLMENAFYFALRLPFYLAPYTGWMTPEEVQFFRDCDAMEQFSR